MEWEWDVGCGMGLLTEKILYIERNEPEWTRKLRAAISGNLVAVTLWQFDLYIIEKVSPKGTEIT